MNYFSLMMRKRFRKDEEDDAEEDGGSKNKKNRGRGIGIVSSYAHWSVKDSIHTICAPLHYLFNFRFKNI